MNWYLKVCFYKSGYSLRKQKYASSFLIFGDFYFNHTKLNKAKWINPYLLSRRQLLVKIPRHRFSTLQKTNTTKINSYTILYRPLENFESKRTHGFRLNQYQIIFRFSPYPLKLIIIWKLTKREALLPTISWQNIRLICPR